MKEAVLPFASFPGADTLLSREMRSTVVVMGQDRTFPRAFPKTQMGAGVVLPVEGRVFLSAKDAGKSAILAGAARDLIAMGFRIVATRGTAQWLAAQGIASTPVNNVCEGRPNIVDRLKKDDIALVMNTTEGTQAVSDSRNIRTVALHDRIPCVTTAAGAVSAAAATKARLERKIGPRTLQCRPRPAPAQAGAPAPMRAPPQTRREPQTHSPTPTTISLFILRLLADVTRVKSGRCPDARTCPTSSWRI